MGVVLPYWAVERNVASFPLLYTGRNVKQRLVLWVTKNTWIISTTCLSCLGCTSMIKACYQVSFLGSWLKSFCLFFQKTYLATFHATKEFLQGLIKANRKPYQKCWLKGDTNSTKEKLLNCTLTLWTLHVMHTKGMQLKWSKFCWGNLNLCTIYTVI